MFFSNLDFLPQKQDSILIDRKSKVNIILLEEKIVSIAIDALKMFLENKLFSFDAQVGENLCQIRAYKVLLLSNQLSIKKESHISEDLRKLTDLHKKIKKFILKIRIIKESKKYNDILDKKETVYYFFKNNNIYSILSKDTIFLFLSYFLKIFSLRKDKIPIAIDCNYISEFLKISKYLTRRIAHNYQKKLSQLSCDFLMCLPNDTDLLDDYRLMLPSLLKTSDDDRCVLPCYLVTYVILNHMIHKELPLVVIINRKLKIGHEIDRITLLFVGDKRINNFVQKEYSCNLFSNGLVIEGEVVYDNNYHEDSEDYIDRFLQVGVKDIILTNTAIHPQYSGNKLAAIKSNPYQSLLMGMENHFASSIKNTEEKFIFYKNNANFLGCSREDQKLFFLRHIFCNQLADEVKFNNIKNEKISIQFPN